MYVEKRKPPHQKKGENKKILKKRMEIGAKKLFHAQNVRIHRKE
jgi:hypothetical protein